VGEQATERGEAEAARRRCGWRWWVGVVMLAAAAVMGLLWLSDVLTARSAEQRLAAIQAARAIPDDENAAVIYKQLRQREVGWDMPSTFYSLGDIEVWRSQEHPDAAEWLESQQETIALLMEACRREKCRFKIGVKQATWRQDIGEHASLLNTVHGCVGLLIRAANNDIGDGRIEAGRDKCLCVMQMAKHIYQQEMLTDFLVAISFEAVALQSLCGFVAHQNAMERDLEAIEPALLPIANKLEEKWSRIREIEDLYECYQLSALQRLKRTISDLRDKNEVRKKAGEIYLRLLAHRCGIRILIALRRYKNEHGRWPRSLEDIKGIAPAEVFIDPRNEGSFVYRLTDGGFELYSKGPNKIDEEGKFKDGADDWCIWPPAGSKIKMEQANAS